MSRKNSARFVGVGEHLHFKFAASKRDATQRHNLKMRPPENSPYRNSGIKSQRPGGSNPDASSLWVDLIRAGPNKPHDPAGAAMQEVMNRPWLR